MYHVRIFKSHEDAKSFAKYYGFVVDNSYLYRKESAKCRCGSTGVAAFSVDEKMDRELILGVCNECGEEYQ